MGTVLVKVPFGLNAVSSWTFLLHLDRNRPVAWDDDAWELVLGPGVPVVASIPERRGYVHRIRFEDRPGGGRVMRFGTELPGRGTTWENLDKVTLTFQGLTTTDRPDGVRIPLAEASRTSEPGERSIITVTLSGSRSRAVMTARQDDPVKRAVMHLDRALREQSDQIHSAVDTIRRLLEADQTPENIARLRLALGRGQVWTEQRAGHRRAVIDQLKARPTPVLLLKAAQLVQDPDATPEEREAVRAARERQAAQQRALAEERTAKARCFADEQRRRETERHQHEAERQQREAERRSQAEQDLTDRRRQAETAERQAHAEKLAYLALFVSGALKKAAREGRTTTWEEIAEKTGQRQLARLTHQDKLSLLETVEKNTLPGSPLWSVVLAGAGEALHLHLEVDLRRAFREQFTALVGSHPAVPSCAYC
ncbi:coiled-coil domain-containing protein [Streptomyces erythrochromogenes]|uniref:hypothetical protein n=1 Tax=Streptomyces erythrochromogenes TaxID=285574 RepID=UPI0036B55FEC